MLERIHETMKHCGGAIKMETVTRGQRGISVLIRGQESGIVHDGVKGIQLTRR